MSGLVWDVPAVPVEQPWALTIRVHGHPAKQGSKDFMGMIARNRPRMVESDEKLPAWRTAVVEACRMAMLAAGGWVPIDAACEVDATVFLPRPKSVTREFPERLNDGDGDKYARAIGDAMKLGGVFVDDSRITDWHCRKRYANDRPTGAIIHVRPLVTGLL